MANNADAPAKATPRGGPRACPARGARNIEWRAQRWWYRRQGLALPKRRTGCLTAGRRIRRCDSREGNPQW
jgi:hypothetical protein